MAHLNKAAAAMGSDEPEIAVSKTKHDPSRHMLAAEWEATKTVRVAERPRPVVTDPEDVILRVTSTCICGSDLHLYLNAMPGMQKGDVLGHEFMGVVEDLGPGVKDLKKGDRVVSAFDMACGCCFYCNKQLYTSCDRTNPSPAQEKIYAHRTGGFHGYSHLTGGWEGGQAEYARVPLANVNTLKIPAGLTDDQVVLLSDVLPTAWHGAELGEVGKGDTVAIWGAGPVGQACAKWCFVRGARRVILIDDVKYRLDHAVKHIPGIEVINFAEKTDVLGALWEKVGKNGLDVGIECVGFHYAKSLLHKVEMALKLETDPADMVNEMIYAVRKGGRISIIGAYAGFCNHFNIGAFMEKCMTMKAGQCPVQKYWHKLLKMVEDNTFDPRFLITHTPPLKEAPHAYKIFNDKLDNCIKVVMKPGHTGATAP